MKRRIKDNGPRTWRSWFRVGPGLVLAVVASIFIWMRATRQPGHTPAGPLSAAAVQQAGVSRTSAPDPEWIMENAGTFHLTSDQAATMRRLAARWGRETRDLRGDLAAATKDFDAAMEAKGGGGIPLADVQRLGLPVSDLTRQLASARRSWWGEASTHLSAAQRTAVEEAWSRRFERRPTGQPAGQAKTPPTHSDGSKVMG